MTVPKDEVRRIFNRLRARLLNTIEQMPFDKLQQDAYKQTIKDITSNSWNDITKMCIDHGLISEENEGDSDGHRK